MSELGRLTSVSSGMRILFGGDRLIAVPDEIVARFREGDALVVAESTAEVLLIPAEQRARARAEVTRAAQAFDRLRHADDRDLTRFYQGFAERLGDEAVWSEIARVNARDVADAKQRGRSTTRLLADERMRRAMIEGLSEWREARSRRGELLESVQHEGWRADLVGAPLGVVAFVFEGRPNVLADATGVLRGGNTAVLRIGRDALRTAKQILDTALRPALREAGLPEDCVCLLDSAEHAGGWALFQDPRLSLAVARGSGPAVATLGSLARQAGIPVSLHGTGGAWIVAAADARDEALERAVFESLDRKVCNTLNTLCIPRAQAGRLVAAALRGAARAGSARGESYKLHVVSGSEGAVPAALFAQQIRVQHAAGSVLEAQAQLLDEAALGHEWEWEGTPEFSLAVVDDVSHAVGLFNLHSPQFVASLISDDDEEHERFYADINAPFVGEAHTRWVDGQKALAKPELGLSNWQHGRLFGRGGILSGDGVYTVRTRARSLR
jgi:glutamate-5-semialdehyde dehydrogenase